jgi:alpha-amylase
VALASVLRRRPESYHATILAAAAEGAPSSHANSSDVLSPHEQQPAGNADLAALLVYDDHERRGGLARIMQPNGAAVGDFDRAAWTVDAVSETRLAATRTAAGLTLRKAIELGGGRLDPTLSISVEVHADADFSGSLELEWNTNVSGGGANPDAYYRWQDGESRHDAHGSLGAGRVLSFGNTYEGVDVALSVSPATDLEWFPVETVSQSEGGYERVYQGSCLLQRWPLRLAAGASSTFSATLRVVQSRDRAVDEVQTRDQASP